MEGCSLRKDKGGRSIKNEFSVFYFGFGSRIYAAIDATAPVFAASSFRDVKRIRVIAAVPSRSSPAIVQSNQSFQNIILCFFHGRDRHLKVKIETDQAASHPLHRKMYSEAFFMPQGSPDFGNRA